MICQMTMIFGIAQLAVVLPRMWPRGAVISQHTRKHFKFLRYIHRKPSNAFNNSPVDADCERHDYNIRQSGENINRNLRPHTSIARTRRPLPNTAALNVVFFLPFIKLLYIIYYVSL